MYYRITDENWIPYLEGYNCKDFRELSYAIWNVWEDWRKYNDITAIEIEIWLKEWCRDFEWYYVEERKKPFDNRDTYLILNQ